MCSSDYSVPKNQKELAESYGVTQQTMNNYMRMADMIPELEDLVDTGIVITEKYRPIYEKQARENQLSGLKQNQSTVSVNLPKRIEPENKIDVREKLASVAGVSGKTYRMGKKILDSDNEEIKERS